MGTIGNDWERMEKSPPLHPPAGADYPQPAPAPPTMKDRTTNQTEAITAPQTETNRPTPKQPITHTMALTLSESTSAAYTPCPAGTFPARLCGIVDLGTHTAIYEGEAKAARKLLLTLEILDPDNRRDDGTAHTVSKRFTASLHTKAALRKLLEGWRGRPFTPEELKAFDLRTLLGLACLAGVVHTEKGDRVYSNLSGCMKLPKGMPTAPGTEPLVSFDLDAPDWVAFAGLGSRLQGQIAESPEFARANPPAHVQLGIAAQAGAYASASPAPAPLVQHAAQPVPAPAQHHAGTMPEFAPHDAAPAGAGSGFDDMADDAPF